MVLPVFILLLARGSSLSTYPMILACTNTPYSSCIVDACCDNVFPTWRPCQVVNLLIVAAKKKKNLSKKVHVLDFTPLTYWNICTTLHDSFSNSALSLPKADSPTMDRFQIITHESTMNHIELLSRVTSNANTMLTISCRCQIFA